MIEQITKDSFIPLIEATEERRKCAAAFLDTQSGAREILHRIKARQAAERRRFYNMLSDLKAEEKRLRQKVREEAANRAKAAATGAAAPKVDISTGARLAALPDEIAALEMLIAEKRMTDEERERWAEIVGELSDRATAYERAHRAEVEELTRWKVYFFEAVNYPKWGINTDINGILAEGYALNKTAENEADSGADILREEGTE